MSNLIARRTVYAFLLAPILIVFATQTALAEGIIESLLGLFQPLAPTAPQELPPQRYSYAEPVPLPDPLSESKSIRDVNGPFVAYCVRLCDGYFFPLPRSFAISTAEQCRSFCPAAKVKVFGGNNISHAASADGSRYINLDTALLYRTRLVDNCTCNGRDAFGLARLDVANDPTLRAGDIVATNDGFLAYVGPKSGRRNADFTPVGQYSVISSDTRRKLTETKVLPAPKTAVQSPIPIEMKSVSRTDRRAQLLR
jgi:hypothetical protein